MQYRNILFRIMIIIGIGSLLGCTAMQTEFGKRNLDLQTRMTKTIFLEPVAPHQRTVFVQVRNTSGKQGFNLQQRLVGAIERKGYKIESDPSKAHYLIQANVLGLSKVNLREAESAFDSGFGGGLLGATIAGVAGGDQQAVLGAGLAGAIVGIAADAMVKDTCYTIITDVQLGERIGGVKEVTVSRLSQGTSTRTVQAISRPEQWKKYQTRIVSTANKANLHLAEATPILVDELVNSIAGLM